jgi:hypothetical protein
MLLGIETPSESWRLIRRLKYILHFRGKREISYFIGGSSLLDFYSPIGK